MSRTTISPSAVRLTLDPPSRINTDLLVIPLFEGESAIDTIPSLDSATAGELRRATESGEVSARPFEFFTTPLVDGAWRARRVAFVGAGRASDATPERLRKLATAVGMLARQRHIPRIAFLLRGPSPSAAMAQAVADGFVLSTFSGDVYKTGERIGPPADEMMVATAEGQTTAGALEKAVERGRILGESANLARSLSNEPSNVLTPRVFAERGAQISKEAGLHVEVLDEHAIERLGMGLLLGVARGSVEPPRVLVMKHEPSNAPKSPVLGLVGKGITFDTGGISIKPADGMERMKDDMAGGAAVVCAMRAIALLRAPVRVIGIVPMTENMPGGRALKPGDVLTGASGTTVEVINTDAEGRLILGDGLWYARHLGATHLVDVATLTGACMVALGKVASGLFGQPDDWVETVRATSQRAGDRCWPLPLFDEYAEQLRSEIADIVNSGGRPAGACTAAMFLREFAGGLPWAHLDVAGTAWADEAKPFQPKGATGVAVRTLAELALGAESWRQKDEG
jgi:leucyl aminopeptidase